jgi:hypothetical protein
MQIDDRVIMGLAVIGFLDIQAMDSCMIKYDILPFLKW